MTSSVPPRASFRAVAVGTLAAGACLGVLLAGCSPSPTGAPRRAAATSPATLAAAARADNQLEDGYVRTVKTVLPSVVQITARQGLGSGVVYDDSGHIVTNAHVVGRERSFKVTTANGSATLTAKLVSSYPAQDLAVLKLDRTPKELHPARFGDSSKVQIGQVVLAMGSPLGLSGSVTQGIVSATGRTVSEPAAEGSPGATIADMVQTSAAINPGNSGGALVNLDNQVVGIPTLAATDPQLGNGAAPGIGFALPASTVKKLADQIIKKGRVTDSGRAALGLTARTLLGSDLQPAGVVVARVTPGGPADDAGIRAEDVITAVAGAPVTTLQSLSEALATRKPGQKVEVKLERGGEERTVEVKLGELSANAS
ncbi:S1C family serine protease [Streptomyces sp. NPDC059740]|uniref:S1C family serine protease n=1 Tax=Streptomyces sp. NPDC059740 TaxID=3346926 RepID=UPI00365A2E0E